MVSVLCGLLLSPATTVYRIEGDAYFRFVREGRAVFARSIGLRSEGGRLVSACGLPLVPSVSAQPGFTLDADGTVRSAGSVTGRVMVATFASSPSGPDPSGFFRSAARAQMVEPGGTVRIVAATTAPKPVQPSTDQVAPSEPKETAPPQPMPDPEFLRSGGVEVSFQDEPKVTGDSLTLGQIATVFARAELAPTLTGLDLGPTPAFGVARTIDRTFVLGRLRLAGVEVRSVRFLGPLRTTVRRAGQDVPHSEFVEAAVAYLAKGGSAQWESPTPGPTMTVPAGELRLTAETSSTNGLEASVTVGVYVDGKRFNGRTLRLRSTAPVASFRVGSVVPVRVKSGSVTVQTRGRVVQIDQRGGTVTVQLVESTTRVVGTGTPDGAVEVRA